VTVITELTCRAAMTSETDLKTPISQDPHDPAFYRDPAACYRTWHIHPGPFWWQEYGFWCLKDFGAVDAALRDRRLKRLAPAEGGGCLAPQWPGHLKAFARTEQYSLLALENAAHARLRRYVAATFSSRRIIQLESTIRTVAHEAVDRVAELDTAELLEWARHIPVVVIARLLGVPEEEGGQLLAWSNAMVRVYTLTQSRAEEDAAEVAAAAFERYLLDIVAKRRTRPGDDLISELCSLADRDRLSDAEIVSTAILLLNAGHEATVHQLGNAVVTLLEHEGAHHWLDTPERRKSTVQELSRFRTPLHLFTRYAQEDMSLGHGVTLKRGEQLGLLLGAANHDPARFAKPWQFNPERTDGGNVSFGAGVHYCTGVQLARLEIGIALQVLFERLPHLALAEPPEVSDTWHFHGLERLRVHPHGAA
jgi:unspecific monooxygenase